MKNHIRDYATAAFRFYAQNGMSAEYYKSRIYNEALEEQKKVEKGCGISCPTEAAIMRAEQRVNEKIAEIKDMEAVDKVMAELSAEPYPGKSIMETIKIVYFKDANKNLKKGDIHNRVHQAVINIPASERSIYGWLNRARVMFAEKRGLRI